MSKPRINDDHLKRAPADAEQLASFIRDIQRLVSMPVEDVEQLRQRLQGSLAGTFSYRDEANALIALAVRNGPLEALHAGKHSVLLEDDTLSRVGDDEMRVLMIYATRMLASLLALRELAPEAYRMYVEEYGANYCYKWER